MTWREFFAERGEQRHPNGKLKIFTDLAIGAWVVHRATDKARFVTGLYGDSVQLSQVVKLESGETFYWCSRDEVQLIG